MLIIALVLAVIGLAALVFAVVTSNALVAWVCIGASALGVLLLIVDALGDRRRRQAGPAAVSPPAISEPQTDADTEAAAVGETAETPDSEADSQADPEAEPDESDADDQTPDAEDADVGDDQNAD